MFNQGRVRRRERNNGNYGIDKMEKLTDRLQILDSRGFNNPHLVGMAPVEGDVPIMVKHNTPMLLQGQDTV